MKLHMGKSTQGEKIRFQKTSMAITREKTTSLTPQIVVLFCVFTQKYKNGFPTWRTMRKMKDIVRENALVATVAWGREIDGWIMKWAAIFGYLLAQYVKIRFSKKWWLPPYEFDFHTLPLPIHQLPQPIYGKNKWLGIKNKKGSWHIYGFSHWHLALPYWLKGLNNFPPYSLWNHAPISLLHWHS